MKIRKAPCRILAMALAVTVFTTSTSLTTLAERGEGYGQAEDATGAVQTASEAMPEIDSSGSANETFSESRTENSVDISGGGTGDISQENPPADEIPGQPEVPSEPVTPSEPEVPGGTPGQPVNPEEKPDESVSPEEKPDGSVSPEEKPDGSVSPEEKPDGSVSPEEKPDGSVSPEEKPDESENPEENLDGVENPDELLDEELLDEELLDEEQLEEEESSGYLLCGKIYEDRNGNGQQDEDEIGLPDIDISVYKSDTNECVANIMTDSDGRFELDELEEGSYTLEIIDDEWLGFYYDIERSAADFPGITQLPGEGDAFVLRIMNVEAAEMAAEQEEQEEQVQQEEQIQQIQELELGLYVKEVFLLDFYDPSEGGMDDVLAETTATNVKIVSKLMQYDGGLVGRRKNSSGTLESFSIKTVDRQNIRLFCLQMKEHAPGSHKANVGGIPKTAYGNETKHRRCELAAYYSEYYPGWGKLSRSQKDRYHLAAQAIIWETMEGDVSSITFYYNPKGVDGNKVGDWTYIDISQEKAAIQKKIEQHNTKPSFNGKEVEAWKNSSNLGQVFKYTDANKVLSGYEVVNFGSGIKSAKIVGNELHVVMKADTKIGNSYKINLRRYNANTGGSYNVYYSSGTLQDVFKFGKPDVDASVTIKYVGKGTITVRKIDDAGNPVAGVTFRYGPKQNSSGPLSSTGGSPATTKATDANGFTTIDIKVADKDIYIQEHQVPVHLQKDTTVKKVFVPAGGNGNVVFQNKRQFFVTLKKVDAETGKPIPGVVFDYWDEKTGIKYSGTTDANGQFTSKVRYAVGTTIVMKETGFVPNTATAKNYSLPQGTAAIQKKVITATDYTFVFPNTINKTPVRIRKVLKSDNSVVIPKVSFKVGPNLNGREGDLLNGYKIYETDAKGEIVTDPFRVDQTIYYQEIKTPNSPVWIQIDPVRRTANRGGVNYYNKVENEDEPVPILVKKRGSDGRPLAGVTFRLDCQDKKTGIWKALCNVTTGTNGEAVSAKKVTWSDVKEGRVRLVEISLGSVKGYLMPENKIFVVQAPSVNEMKNVIEYTAVNPKIPTVLTINKYDKDNTRKPLDGAVFRITDEHGNFVMELTTKNGIAETKELLADTVYYIEEIKAPRGYTMCGSFAEGEKQTFTITEKGHIFGADGKIVEGGINYSYRFEVPNDPIYGWIEVYKKDGKGRNLQGFEFTIYKNGKVVDTLTTDENGYDKSIALVADGPYTVYETYRPPEYTNSNSSPGPVDFLFTGTSSWTDGDWKCSYDATKRIMTYEVTNREVLGSITVHKVDSEDKTVPVEGAEFVVYNLHDETKTPIGGPKKTDKNGYVTFTDLPLVTEANSSLKEQGHYVVEEITAGKNHIFIDGTVRYVDLVAGGRGGRNKDITVTVENPPYKGTIEIKKVDREESTKTLEGAEFTVYEESAYKAALASGQKPVAVDKKETGTDGIASFYLRYGTYIIKETKAPLYYYIDEETGGNSQYWDASVKGYRVTITEDGEVIPLTVTNPKLFIKVEVTKLGYMNTFLPDVTFQICKKDGTYVDKFTTDTKGKGYSKEYTAEELGEGAYIKEVGSVPGYEPYTKHIEIKFKTDSIERVQLVSETVKNQRIPKGFRLQKINENGEGCNAYFRVTVKCSCMSEHDVILYEGARCSEDNNVYDFTEMVARIDTFIESYPWHEYNNHYVVIDISEYESDPKYQMALDNYQLKYEPWIQEFSEITTGVKYYSFDEDTLTLTCVNEMIPIELTLAKYSVGTTSSSTSPIQGAIFSIKPNDTPHGISDDEIIVDMTKASEKTVLLPWAESYTITEIKTPDGYVIPQYSFPYGRSSVTIDRSDFNREGGVITKLYTRVDWNNTKTIPIRIKKVGSDGKALDATFRISQNGEEKSIVEVKAENGGVGTIDSTNLAIAYISYEDYTCSMRVEEISVDSDYIRLNDAFDVVFCNKPLDNQINIINAPSGVTGKVEYVNGVATFVITITNEKKNNDFFMKKKGAGTDSVNANVTLEAHRKGTSTCEKQDSYQISNGSGSGTNINNVMQSLNNASGYDIYMTETSASEGYKKHPRFKAFTYYPDKEGLEKFQDVSEFITITPSIENKTNMFTITLRNEPEDPIELTLIKRDTEDPNTYLAGAVFEIVPEGQPAIELTTNGTEKGATVTLPIAGKYTVRETKAPEGYAVDGIPREYDATDFKLVEAPDGSASYQLTVTYDNRKAQGQIKIEKYDKDQPDNTALKGKMAGAEFGIYKWDGSGTMVKPGVDQEAYEKVLGGNGYTLVDTVTIGEDGTGISKDLPYNQDGYVILETKAPTDYEVSYEIQIRKVTSDGVTMTVRYGDPKKKGKLTIHKVDEANKPLANARFQIYNADTGNAVGEELLTGPDGKIGPVELPYGKYYIKEITPPPGYVKVSGDWEKEFTLNDSNPVYEPIVPNNKTEYAFRLIKQDAEGNGLAGAEFGLYEAGSPSPHEDSSVEAIHTFCTNISGVAIVSLEEAGDYDIYELEAPDGYELLTEKWEIHVDDDMPTAEVGPIVNNRYPITLKILKKDEENQPLAGAVFEIKNKETGKSVAITGETDENGEVTVEVPAGYITYTATELKAPEGYVLDDMPRDVSVSKVSDAETGEETFLAEPLTVVNKKQKSSTGTIKLVKTEEGKPNKLLEGAVYGIYSAEADPDASGEPMDTLTTNAIGEAEVSELPYGTYTVKEITPPAGYGWDKASPHRAVLSEDTPVVTLQAEDPLLLGGFRVRKADAMKENLSLEGAEFAVFTDRESAEAYNAKEVGEIKPKAVQTTGTDGLAVFEKLPYGTYYVKEIKAPKGYELIDIVEEAVVDEHSLEEGAIALTFRDYPEKGSLRVVKWDKDTGEHLEGAEFKVEKLEEDGTYSELGTYSTDEKGTFLVDRWPGGPDGENWLECGTYRITETKAPEGYRLSDPVTQTVEVTPDSWNNPVRVDFEDERIETSISVYKIDGETRTPLSGAYFDIYQANEEGYPIGDPVDSLYTDETGRAQSKKLPLGKYVLKEVWVPEGYILDMEESDDFTFEVTEESGDNIEKIITNYPLKGELRVEKKDEETQEGLNGVEFTVYRYEYTGFTEYAELTTKTVDGQAGVATLADIPYGIYYLEETGVPEGYINQGFTKEFWIGDENDDAQVKVELEVSNTRGKGQISLVKVDEDDGDIGVGGAIYGIYTAMENGDVKADSLLADNQLITTADKTPAVSKEIPWGTYYVKEISAPAGYEKNDEIYIAELSEEETLVEIQARDKKETGTARIYKVNEDGQPVPDAVFAIYTKDQYDKLLQGDDVLGIYPETNAEGYASCENLRLDETYVVVEHMAPAGYALNEDFEEEFTPTAEKKEFEFTCVDNRIGEILIRKVDEDLEPLTVAIFHLYSSGPDGKAETEDDLFIGEFGNSDNDEGIARYPTNGLLNGWYYVKEVRAPLGGYQISSKICEFELTDTQRSYDKPEEPFINEGYDAEFEIWKKDEKNEPMTGAGFTLYEWESVWNEEIGDKEDILTNPQEVELDEDGHAHVTGLKANKIYLLEETTVPKGYKKVEDILIDFTEYGELKTENGKNCYYYGETVVNYPIKGKIRIQKEVENPTDIEMEVNLEGAVFEIRDKNNKVLDTLTTDKDGVAMSDVELPYGKYQVVETKAPTGTELNSTPGTVEIDGSMEDDIYQYTHVNQTVTGKIKIIKTDGGKPEKLLAEAEFDLIRKEGNVTVDHLETDENGVAESKELPLGQYLVRETKAPLGHTFGEVTEQEAVISEEEQTVELTFTNPQGDGTGLLVQKYDKDDPTKVLAGAEFALYRKTDSETEGEAGANAADTATDTRKAEGGDATRNTNAEKDTEEAEGADTASNANETRDADSITDTNGTKDAKAAKSADMESGMDESEDADTPEDIEAALEGAELHGVGTTDETGRIKFSGLEKGEYILVERKAPEGYRTGKQQMWEVSLDEEETIIINVPNEKPKGRIRFTKKGDIFAGVEENPTVLYPEQKVLKWKEAEIEGAEIEIYTTGEVKWNGKTYQEGDVITTVKSGEISDYLPVGNYEYQEKSAPSQYIVDTERYLITVEEEEVTQTPGEDESKPAEAELTNLHGEVELILDKDFEDEAYLGKEILTEQYEKIKFGIYTEDYLYAAKTEEGEESEEPVVEPDTLIGVFGVDADGKAVDAAFKLPEGRYYAKELATAEGYKLDETKYGFQISYDNRKAEITLPEDGEPIVNERKDGMLVVHKRGYAFSNVEAVSAFGKWTVNTPVYTEMGIAGAEIEVYATEETRIGDKVYREGELIETLISSGGGEEEIPASISLPFGTYLLKEVKAPEGYILDGEEKEVILQPESPEQEIVLTEYNFINDKETVTPGLYKKFFGLTDEEASPLYAQVVFGVYAAEDIRGNTDSAVLRENMLIHLIQPGEDGRNRSEDYLPAGKYYIKELATAEGYALDEKKYYFTVKPDSSGLLAVTEEPEAAGGDETETGGTGSEGSEEGGTAQEKIILNYPEGERIPFGFRKVDDHGRGLPGAVFRLYMCTNREPGHEHSQLAGEDSCFKEIEGLSPVTGGEDGMVYFGELPQGSYQLEEVQAPEGYECPKGQWYIRVDPEDENPITIQAREKDGEVPPAFMKVEQNGQSGWEFRLLNYKKQELPMAGGTGTIPYVGGGGALLSMAGLLWKKRRKEEEPE